MASTIASFANFLKQSRTHAIDNREVLIAGVLYKKPERNSLLWKKRYCVIYANELQIVYFLSLEDFERRTIRGKIPFSSVHAWDGKPNGFQFYTPADHCFRVYTETAADQLKWLEVMQKCIDNAPDRKDGARVDKSTTGEIDFNSFMKWWNDDHAADNQTEAMRRYQAKFKFLKARIANPEVGNIETEAVGAFPSFEFRVNFYHTGINNERQQISPWHDIPLYNPDGTVNFICEIPKWTRKKMEIATGEPFNPIKQDTKNGKLREYGWGEMMFNYGAMPQTWEDPSHVTEGTGCVGDNDPIDVVEIGTKQWRTGSIVQVKILGVLALIDDNETDWKVICINVEDHYAPLINDVADIEAHMPGCITAIHDWLRDYKLPQVNKYGYDDKCMGRDFAEATVAETHEFWKLLIEQRGGQATV
uniref:inorganic diphosphatase n=1 Tax=Hyaloperonospora arabidopsidis (strain Emoy2) TaxID=559515 RepID=M4BYR5_HYAAE